MSGAPLSLLLPADLLERLQVLAQRDDRPLAAVLLQAAEEFADRWEEYYQTCEALVQGEPDRATLFLAPEEAEAATDPLGNEPRENMPTENQPLRVVETETPA